MPYTDTTISNLIVNVLTKSQYDSLTPNQNELYLITDEPSNILPTVTAADNGKVLTVVNGVWTAVQAGASTIPSANGVSF